MSLKKKDLIQSDDLFKLDVKVKTHIASHYVSKKEHESKVKELEQEITKHKEIVEVVLNVKGEKGNISEKKKKKLQLLMKNPQLLDKVNLVNLDYLELSNGKVIIWEDNKFQERLIWINVLAKLGYKEDVAKLISVETFAELYELAINIIKLKETDIFSMLHKRYILCNIEKIPIIACLVAFFGTSEQMKILIPDEKYGRGSSPSFTIPENLCKYFGNLCNSDCKLSILGWILYGNNLDIIQWFFKHSSDDKSTWDYKLGLYYNMNLPKGFSLSKECVEYLWSQGKEGKEILQYNDKRNYELMLAIEQTKQDKEFVTLLKNPEKISDISLEECQKFMDKFLFL